MKIYLLLIFFIANTIYSQTTIKGSITDLKGKAISNSSVLILKKATDDVIAYAISNGKGFYSITFSSSYNEIDIQVKCMGYETIIETNNNLSQTKNFNLKDKAFELKEVIVKSSPITQKGDTIKYYVNSFSKEQDRSIGDVLKRMPALKF
jgi:hypothetical protein